MTQERRLFNGYSDSSNQRTLLVVPVSNSYCCRLYLPYEVNPWLSRAIASGGIICGANGTGGCFNDVWRYTLPLVPGPPAALATPRSGSVLENYVRLGCFSRRDRLFALAGIDGGGVIQPV